MKYTLLLLIFVMLYSVGCRKSLCYQHPHDGSITVNVDWRNLPSDARHPSGVRVIFYDQPDQLHPITFNFPAEGGSRDVIQGDYRILVANNDPELVLYRSMSRWETAEAFTASKSQNPYKSPPSNVTNAQAPGVRQGISAPDLLMSTNRERIFIKEVLDKKYVVTATPKCYTHNVVIRISVSGSKNISEARGFLTGVAPSVFLGLDSINQSEQTLLFEYGTAMSGTELRAQFMVFGMVDKPNDYYKLGLELLLLDKSVLYFDFDVSDQITDELKRAGGLIIINKTIVVPDVVGPGGGGGFNPGIGDWGDEEDIVIPMN